MIDYLEFPDLIRLLQGAKKAHVARHTASPKKSLRMEAMIGLMAYCGLRLHELLSLTLSMVLRQDVILRVIYLPAEITKYKHPREVFVPDPLHEILTRYLWMRLKMKIDSPLLFPSIKGTKLEPTTIRKALALISFRVLQRRVNPHALRHTFGTLLARSAPIRVVQEAMGHSQLSSTMIYTHVTRPDIQKAVGEAFNTPPIVSEPAAPSMKDFVQKAFEPMP